MRLSLFILALAAVVYAKAVEYRNYQHFLQANVEGKHFKVVHVDNHSPVLVLAIHGGNIESFTSELARLVAREREKPESENEFR